MAQIPLSDAIQQLRDELREAILDGKDQDIVFTPNSIDIELSVNFSVEAKAGGGFKLLPFTSLETVLLRNPQRGPCCLNHPQREQSIHTCGQRLEADMAHYTNRRTHPQESFLTRNTESVLRHGQNLERHDPPV